MGRSHCSQGVFFNDSVVLAKGCAAEANSYFRNVLLMKKINHTAWKSDAAHHQYQPHCWPLTHREIRSCYFNHWILGSINLINATTHALNCENFNDSSVLIILYPRCPLGFTNFKDILNTLKNNFISVFHSLLLPLITNSFCTHLSSPSLDKSTVSTFVTCPHLLSC